MQEVGVRKSESTLCAVSGIHKGSNEAYLRRYGNITTLPKPHADEYTEFSKYFMQHFAPEILKAYLGEIEKWVAKTTWLSKPVLTNTLNFLDDCIKPKLTWDLLKPHVENLITHVVFPLLCQSEDDLELFDTDPQEYVHRKLNFYEEISAPDVAASTFLISLTKARKKQTFTVLNFVNGIVTRYESAPEAEKNYREKEGALRMIGTLSEVLLAKKSPIAHQVESFFVRHVFPEFRSPQGYLRARACDTLQKFDRMDFSEESNLILVYRNIIESLTDPELPVRVEAAMALQVLIRHDVISNEMRTNIPQIMQQLLKLANEVDVDSLANVMEDFVEVFAAELTPFAVALSEQLRDTYLRIVREIVERAKDKDGEPYGDYLDDKSITALGVLQTIGTLILTLESTPEVLLHLETILMPVVSITLENKLYDLYNEVFEIIDSCTFSAKAISPTMWQAFELMHKTFKSGAELYLEDMLPALDNFFAYGSQTMIQNPAYIEASVSMVQDIFNDDKVGGMDRICACKLAESIMLSLRGHVDQYIQHFIEMAMDALLNDELKIKSYRIHLIEMNINAIYYNPMIALQVLEAKEWTNKFFSLWFSNIENMTRVQDKKLSILAISSLLTLRAEEVPMSVQQGWPRLLQGVCRLFQTLPAAIRSKNTPPYQAYL
jgi:importin-7